MNLRKLEHAVCLANVCNYARAAEQLHITQSALTRSIQSLESELGISLFDRSLKGVSVSVTGAEVLARAKNVLRSANGFKHEVALIKDSQLGDLSFGCGPVPSNWLLPKALAAMVKQYPQLNIDVRTRPVEILHKALTDEAIEFYLGVLPLITDHSIYEVEHLFDLDVAFFVNSHHPLTRCTNIQNADFAKYPLATPGIPSSTFALDSTNVLPVTRGLLQCEDWQVLISLTRNSETILMASDVIVNNLIDSGELVQLQSNNLKAGFSSKLAMVKLAERTLSPAATVLLTEIKKQL
jgi:DNA-binding transcriptional LysR family regulator